ncbi:MAG TPA: bile acid:sodium symporter, partial [Methylomirabilota bacterium]|nr:bile acid:sodium symporter [Methylomirabilota bacterium]
MDGGRFERLTPLREPVMKDIIVDILKVIAPLSVALIVFCQGLVTSPGKVAAYFRERPWLMLRSLVAVLVLVPAVALGLILALKPSPAIGIALAILVACPPAPLMLSTAPKLGKGSAAFMASLHLSLAVLAFVTVPGILVLISIPLGFEASVDLRSMAWILARTILLPITLGLAVRALFPAFADRAGPTLAKIGTAGLAIVVVAALAAFFPALLRMDLASYLVIAIVGAAALAVGH